MSEPGLALAKAAEDLVGCPFQLHGRDARRGLDCVGLVRCSLETVGRSLNIGNGYGLRNTSIDPHFLAASGAGLEEVADDIAAGDILLFNLDFAQYHLGIISSGQSLIHSHAGLKRVVATPLPLLWRVERHWRLAPDSG